MHAKTFSRLRSKNLSLIIISLATVIQLLMVTAVGVFNYNKIKDELNQKLMNDVLKTEARIQKSLPRLLWNFDDETINIILRSETSNDYITEISVLANGELAFNAVNDIHLEHVENHFNHQISQKSSVIHYQGEDGDEDIGELIISYNNSAMLHQLNSFVHNLLIQSLLVTVFFIFVLWLVFKLFVHHSLDSLHMAKETFNNMSEGFIYANEKGQLFNSNHLAQSLTGFSSQELNCLLLNEFISFESKQDELSFNQAYNSQGLWSGSAWCKTIDRQNIPIYLNLSSVKADDEKLLCYVLIFHDITQEQQNQAALEHALTDAEQAAVAKSQFLSTMSHEIRTPMNGVLGMAQLLEETPLNSEQKEYLYHINSAGQNLLSIINDILDFSKLNSEQLNLEAIEFNLEKMCHSSFLLFSNNKKSDNVELLFEYPNDIPKIFIGDPTRLSQIINNLFSNALKFTHDGYVKLKISYSEVESPPLCISIEDSGIGISEQAQQSLFEEFKQADGTTTRQYGGTGLGLSISKKIALLMGGDIKVVSELDKGSSFNIMLDLPYSNSVDDASILPDILAQETQTKIDLSLSFSGHILVAEDVEANQLIIVKILSRLGLKVTLVDDGQKALEKFIQESFDLVFMDCRMPIMDGYESTQKIRELESQAQTTYTPVIALTANASTKDKEICLEAGMDEVITKPFQFEEIRKCLKQWLNKDENIKAIKAKTIKAELNKSLLTINKETLFQFKEDYAEDADEIYQSLCNSIKQYVDELATPFDSTQTKEYLLTAHSLKSPAANLGAEKLSDLAHQLEMLLRNENDINIENIDNILLGIQQEYPQVVEEYQRLICAD